MTDHSLGRRHVLAATCGILAAGFGTAPPADEAWGAVPGAVLLPGLPHLGLHHRAGWVQAAADGSVTTFMSKVGSNPGEGSDLAV